MIKSFQDEIDQAYLAHFGVKGMRWGVRKAAYRVLGANQRGAAKVFQKSADRKRKAATNLKSNSKQMLGLKSKSGKALFTKADLNKMISKLEKSANRSSSRANIHKTIANQFLKKYNEMSAKNFG